MGEWVGERVCFNLLGFFFFFLQLVTALNINTVRIGIM